MVPPPTHTIALLPFLQHAAVIALCPTDLVDVNIMVWIGFGFLMTFMRRYGYGAVALNYFASALMFLEAILMIGATQVRVTKRGT